MYTEIERNCTLSLDENDLSKLSTSCYLSCSCLWCMYCNLTFPIKGDEPEVKLSQKNRVSVGTM